MSSRYNLRSNKKKDLVPNLVPDLVHDLVHDEVKNFVDIIDKKPPIRKRVPKNVKIRAQKSILGLFAKKLLLFRLKKLLLHAKAIRVISRCMKKFVQKRNIVKKISVRTITKAYAAYKFRKSLQLLKRYILQLKISVRKIVKFYCLQKLKKFGREFMLTTIKKEALDNENRQNEIKSIIQTTVYLKDSPLFRQYQKLSSNHTCMICMETVPHKLMIHSVECKETCQPSYCRTCYRNFIFGCKKNGIYCYSRRMFECIYCNKNIILKTSDIKELHYPSLNKDIIGLYFRILFSLGFEKSISAEEMFTTITSDEVFSITFRLLKTPSGKVMVFLPKNNVAYYEKMLKDNDFPNVIEPENFDRAIDSRLVMNIMTYEFHKFTNSQFINDHLDKRINYTFSKDQYNLSLPDMLKVIYRTEIRNCVKCRKADILGWKQAGCSTEQNTSVQSKYYCTRCTDPTISIRVCPACNVYCTRIDGCNEMTCKCGVVWCYHCNTINKKKNRMSHYVTNSFGPCKGSADALIE